MIEGNSIKNYKIIMEKISKLYASSESVIRNFEELYRDSKGGWESKEKLKVKLGEEIKLANK